MTRYTGTSPTYDEPAEETESFAYEPEPPKPAGAITGSTRLQIPAGLTARPSSGQQLCRYVADNEYPRPLALIVNVKGPAGNTPADPFAQEVVMPAQGSGNAGGVGSLNSGGVLRITYGMGSAVRVLDADLRGGSYQLPPCTTCTVEAFMFGNGPNGPVDVSASLVPGHVQSPARFVHSFTTQLAAGAFVFEKVPYAARWVSMVGGDPTNVGAGQPILTLKQGTTGPFLLHDYTNSVFLSTPGQPVELANRGDIKVMNLGLATVTATVRFFLEP